MPKGFTLGDSIMNTLKVIVNTDWWAIAATILSGFIAATATIIAVVYTNAKTKEQLKKQQEKFDEERKKQFEQSKYVVIKPSLLVTSMLDYLERLVIQYDYNRVLLFSGEDGFEFFDNPELLKKQTIRLFMMENNSQNDIIDITINTETTLVNKDSNKRTKYSTSNTIALLRGGERALIRLNNQQQFEDIIQMNTEKIPHDLFFDCTIIYSTLAEQEIIYRYKVMISNDKRIEIESDGVESITEVHNKEHLLTSTFRNLQDSISSVDRSAYSWQKMAQSQFRGMRAEMMQEGIQPIQNNNTSKAPATSDGQ